MRFVFCLLFSTLFIQEVLPEQKTALVCGGGGFIGHHLIKRYKQEGYWVRGVDLKLPEFESSDADEFLLLDLREEAAAKRALFLEDQHPFDEVVQLAANMGGMGYISTHDAEIMHDSALINLQVLEQCRQTGAKKIFYSSSACVYPERNQLDSEHPECPEDSVYPAAPDTEYGWEKLFSERLYQAYAKDYGLDVRIARFHNIFGPLGVWRGGKEKAPAALCRKIAEAKDGDTIEIWGKGDQTRTFLYIDECIEGIRRLMAAEKGVPILNVGSEELISINDLALLISRIAGKQIFIKNIVGPEGVRGRKSDNKLIGEILNWAPTQSLEEGLRKLYPWIEKQLQIPSTVLMNIEQHILTNSWPHIYYDVLPEIIQKNQFKTVLEVGVALGGHAETLLKNCEIDVYYGVDPYRCYDPNDGFHQDVIKYSPQESEQDCFDYLYTWVKESRLAPYGNRCQLIRKASLEASDLFNEGSLDCVFIDGDHRYEAVLTDLAAWFPKIRKGGMILGDDYWMEPVARAVEEFFSEKNISVSFAVAKSGYKIWSVIKE